MNTLQRIDERCLWMARTFTAIVLVFTGIPISFRLLGLGKELLMLLIYPDLRHDPFFLSHIRSNIPWSVHLWPEFGLALLLYIFVRHLDRGLLRVTVGVVSASLSVLFGWSIFHMLLSMLRAVQPWFIYLFAAWFLFVFAGFLSLLWTSIRFPQNSVHSI